MKDTQMKTQTKFDMHSGGIKSDSMECSSQRIHGRNRLEQYIPNGSKMRSVGYDYNIQYILDLLKKNDWSDVTIIVG
ncbi:MAG: hypothetical protein CL903_01050 [Dehalococcoidia bacterium]|nr:hypothetical protein [Dehalococcoidia bacterium]